MTTAHQTLVSLLATRKEHTDYSADDQFSSANNTPPLYVSPLLLENITLLYAVNQIGTIRYINYYKYSQMMCNRSRRLDVNLNLLIFIFFLHVLACFQKTLCTNAHSVACSCCNTGGHNEIAWCDGW